MNRPFRSNGCQGVDALCRRAVGLVVVIVGAVAIVVTRCC